MSCNMIPMSCLDPSRIFAGVYNPNCGGFGDPSNFQAEQAIYKSSFSELINNYGVNIIYFVNGFNLSAMNILYGEHPTQEYSQPFEIKAYLELQEGVSLSQFGMDSSDELTAYIGIKDYTDKFVDYLITDEGYNVTDEYGNQITIASVIELFYQKNGQRMEPKSDDLIRVDALGCNRPGNRGSKIFRITEVLDQDVSGGMNPMLGSYVWKITAKRYEYDFTTNAPTELENNQVYDNTFSGKLSSTLFPSSTTQEKVYPFNVNTLSKDTIYDMSKNDTDIYGDYY